MSDNVRLGQFLDGTEERDAIHVAIAPVIAAQRLRPGERVALVKGSQELVEKSKDSIGIIDPFLIEGVDRGQRCYLWLHPNTVTGMRHHWRHPSFKEIAPQKIIDESVQILRQAAEDGGMSYDFLVDSLTDYYEYKGYRHMGENEDYHEIDDWNKVWEAWSQVTGKPVPDNAWCPFSCSC